MSEEKVYCKWCDTLIKPNLIVKEYEKGRLVWVGCSDCYVIRTELKKKDVETKQI